MYRALTAISLLIFLSSGFSFSQEPKIEWGKVPLEDLQMTSFPDDSNATAVILYDYGESKFNGDLDIVFQRYLRIKILNKKGYRLGTQSITLFTYDHTEMLSDLDAVTYSLDENNEIVKTELDNSDVFEEEPADKYTSYKFTMPALKPGCVIDIRYKIISTSIYFLQDWIFQWDEPVIWSEYKAIIPQAIIYAFVTSGFEPWYIQNIIQVQQVFRGKANGYLGANPVECNQYRWVVHRARALRDEPYITTISDYENRLQSQLASYSFLNFGTKRVLEDWKTVLKTLLDLNSFEDKIEVTGDVEDLTSEITKGLTTPEEKLDTIYSWITKSIVWNKEQRVFADQDVDDVIEYKKGNSAEITFLLLSMLKSAGIDGDPVILSTRGNGKIQDLYPIVSQFNLTIARVVIGSRTYYIDATNPLRPLGVMPEKILNVKGLVVKPGEPQWVFLSSPEADSEKTIVNLTLNDDGSLTSEIETAYGKYQSLSIRKKLNDESETELVKDLLKTKSQGLDIDSVKIFNKEDINSPLIMKAWISSTEYSQQGGDRLYLNPNLVHRIADNPFKDREREFPVDYAYPSTETIVTNIKIPKDYELNEKYDDKHYVISNKLSYKRVAQVTGSHVQIICRIDIRESRIKPSYYKRLKYFYSEMIAAESEMLVFRLKENQSQNTNNASKQGQ